MERKTQSYDWQMSLCCRDYSAKPRVATPASLPFCRRDGTRRTKSLQSAEISQLKQEKLSFAAHHSGDRAPSCLAGVKGTTLRLSALASCWTRRPEFCLSYGSTDLCKISLSSRAAAACLSLTKTLLLTFVEAVLNMLLLTFVEAALNTLLLTLVEATLKILLLTFVDAAFPTLKMLLFTFVLAAPFLSNLLSTAVCCTLLSPLAFPRVIVVTLPDASRAGTLSE